MSNPVLITGCGCSGTTYLNELLRENDVDSCHDMGYSEDVFVTNQFTGEEVWRYKYGHQGVREYVEAKIPINTFRSVIHITRNPVDTISCVVHKWKQWGCIWKHILETIPQLSDAKDITIKNAMIYWLYWNEMIQKKATARFQFEEILTDPRSLFNTLGFKYLERQVGKVASSDKKNTLSMVDLLSVDAKLAHDIHELASQYGYNIN